MDGASCHWLQHQSPQKSERVVTERKVHAHCQRPGGGRSCDSEERNLGRIFFWKKKKTKYNRGTIADQVFLSHLQSQAASIALHLVQPMVLGLIYRHLLAWLLSSQTPVVRGIIVSSAMQYNESNERGGERESYSITWYVQTKLMSLSRWTFTKLEREMMSHFGCLELLLPQWQECQRRGSQRQDCTYTQQQYILYKNSITSAATKIQLLFLKSSSKHVKELEFSGMVQFTM